MWWCKGLPHASLCQLWSIWRCVPRAVVQSLMTSCSAMTGWRKCNPHQHSTLPPRAASVSDELCCSADVFFMVRSRPSTAASNALVEDLWRQLILSSLSLPLQHHWHTLRRNFDRCHLQSALSLSLYVAVNHQRLSFSSRRSLCLERFPAAHHVCIVIADLSAPPQDKTPLHVLLPSLPLFCCAWELV